MPELDLLTVRLVLGVVSGISLAVMIMLARVNRGMAGVSWWLASSALTAANYLLPAAGASPYPRLIIIINNTATLTSLLLVLVGLLRFRLSSAAWVSWIVVIAPLFALMALVNLDVTWRRIAMHDAVAIALLAGCVIALLWRARGLERLVNGLTTLAFLLLLGVFAWRLAVTLMLGPDFRQVQAGVLPWLFFGGVVWCMGWTYGATVMANLKVQQALAAAALQDPLTGLPNRRAFDDRVRESLAAAERHGRPFGLVIFDLDGFKQVNDRHGHTVGDRLLKAVAQRLSRLSRADETVFRLGGDEFILLLTGLRSNDAMRDAISRFDAELPGAIEIDGIALDIAPSIGGAAFPDDGRDVERLMAVADQRMYAAKAARRPPATAL